jgi:hypothetical protein
MVVSLSFIPGHFTPRERSHNTHLKGDWVGPLKTICIYYLFIWFVQRSVLLFLVNVAVTQVFRMCWLQDV